MLTFELFALLPPPEALTYVDHLHRDNLRAWKEHDQVAAILAFSRISLAVRALIERSIQTHAS
jgi:hypothetical protein